MAEEPVNHPLNIRPCQPATHAWVPVSAHHQKPPLSRRKTLDTDSYPSSLLTKQIMFHSFQILSPSLSCTYSLSAHWNSMTAKCPRLKIIVYKVDFLESYTSWPPANGDATLSSHITRIKELRSWSPKTLTTIKGQCQTWSKFIYNFSSGMCALLEWFPAAGEAFLVNRASALPP